MAAEKNKSTAKLSLEQINAQYGKLPPQAIEVEEAVLGALMLERDAYVTIADIVDTNSFYKEEHRKIFDAIKHLSTHEKPVDLLMVTQELKDSDYVFSTHRGHGHAIAKGCALKRMMAELMGRKTGLSGGHGGSMHLFDPAKGLMGGNGIVAGGIPLSLGAAFTAQYRSTDQVSVVFFSDGVSFCKLNGHWYEKFCDPFIELMQKHKKVSWYCKTKNRIVR